MSERINQLANYLNLNEYQLNKLKINYDKYNIDKLQKRGGVLYAPYASDGFFRGLVFLLLGAPADLIGKSKILLRAQRNIRFCENGFHCVRVGRYVYYANADGMIISKDEFLRAIKN